MVFLVEGMNNRIRDIALRNGTLDRNNVNGLSDRADVSGNARHFCDVEFNYTGYEGEWSAFDPLPKLTQASEKDVRIIIGKERESYEPEFNYKGCEKRRS